MFNEGDTVRIRDDFDGNVTLHGWNEPTIEEYSFTVTTFDAYQKKYPVFSQIVKKGSKQGEVFLKWKNTIFVLSPPRALERVSAVCDCPINRLWAGNGHQSSCREFPTG